MEWYWLLAFILAVAVGVVFICTAMLIVTKPKRDCFHHDHRKMVSWIREQLIDMGSRKEFWCTQCGRRWVV